MIGISEDQATAAAIANTWADTAVVRLDEAREHARTAAQMQETPYLVDCIGLLPAVTTNEVLWQCVASGPEIDQETAEDLRREFEASHGILPNLAFEIVQSADPPSDPVLWGRGSLVLAGGILGILIVALSAIARGPRRGEI